MFDKVNALLQAVHLHERSHFFFASVKDNIDFLFSILFSLILLEMELSNKRLHV